MARAGGGGVRRAQDGEQILPPEGPGVVPGRDHRLDEVAAPARAARGAGLGGVRRQVVHHRLPRARGQRLGIVTAGGGADRVQLTVRVAPRGSGDRPVRPLLGLEVEQRSGGGRRARLHRPSPRHPQGRAHHDEAERRHHAGAPAGSCHPTAPQAAMVLHLAEGILAAMRPSSRHARGWSPASGRSPGLRIIVIGRLPTRDVSRSGTLASAPRSQLRDSAGFPPASRHPGRYSGVTTDYGPGAEANAVAPRPTRRRAQPATAQSQRNLHVASAIAPTAQAAMTRQSVVMALNPAPLFMTW